VGVEEGGLLERSSTASGANMSRVHALWGDRLKDGFQSVRISRGLGSSAPVLEPRPPPSPSRSTTATTPTAWGEVQGPTVTNPRGELSEEGAGWAGAGAGAGEGGGAVAPEAPSMEGWGQTADAEGEAGEDEFSPRGSEDRPRPMPLDWRSGKINSPRRAAEVSHRPMMYPHRMGMRVLYGGLPQVQLEDESFTVTKINNIGRRQARILKLTTTGIENIRNGNQLSKAFTYEDIAGVYLVKTNRLCISFFKDHDFLYESPIAPQIVEKILFRSRQSHAQVMAAVWNQGTRRTT
jgi:hypothetical protein